MSIAYQTVMYIESKSTDLKPLVILSEKSEEVLHLQTKHFIEHTQISHIKILWQNLTEILD